MLRRITLSLAFAASIGVGSAQLPQTGWSLLSPVNIPTVEWSSNGSHAVLTTNSAVEMLDGSTMQILWSVTVTGAEPSIASQYGYSDRAHFSPDGSSVWVRTAPGETFTEFNTTTGQPILTHTFSDWSGDMLLQPVGGELLAYTVTANTGSPNTYVYAYRVYSASSPGTATFTGSLSHTQPNGLLTTLTIPTGIFNGNDMAFFYNTGVNLKTNATTTFGTTGTSEPWCVAVDPQGGLIQQVMSVSGGTYTRSSVQRISGTGAVTWNSTGFSFPGAIGPSPSTGFLSSASTPVAIFPTGNGIMGFNYMTGLADWNTSVETGGIAAFTYEPYALNPANGTLILTTGNSGYAQATLSKYGVSSSALSLLPAVQSIMYGMTGASGISGGSVTGTVLADSFSGSIFNLNFGGTSNGSLNGSGAQVSPAGDFAAILTGSGLSIINSTTGASVGSESGAFNGVSWGTEATNGSTTTATFLADETNGQAVLFTLTKTASGTTIAVTKSFGVADFQPGALTSDGKYALGYAGSNLYVFDLAHLTSPPTQNPYPQYTSYWQDSFRMVPLSGGNMALLEQTATGAQWNVYQFVANVGGSGATVSSVATHVYTPPFTRTTGDRIRAAISPDGVVEAFFESSGVGTNGQPTSDLSFVRLSDGKKIGSVTNVYSYVGSMSFSPDKSLLYATTGGASANTGLSGAVTMNQAGPADLLAFNVPAWLTGITANNPTTIASGMTSSVTVTIDEAAKTGGQVVNLSATNGMSVPSTVTIPAGQTSANATVTAPTTTAQITCKVTATITGNTDSFSASFLINPPALSTLVINSTPVESGAPSSATLTLIGLAPTNGWKVTLAQTGTANPLVSFPTSATVLSGNSTVNFNITTTSSTTSSSATIQGTDPNSNTASGTINLTPTLIKSIVFDQSSVTGGDAVSVTVTIDHNAPTGGFTLNLTSPTDSTFPATVTIPAGKSSIEITGTTVPVASSTTSNFSAALGSNAVHAALTILPPSIKAVQFVQHTVVGGSNASVVVLLSGAAASGTSVGLSSSSSALNAPATKAFNAGATMMLYSIPTTTVSTNTPATLTVTLGSTSGMDTVTIHP